MYACTLNILRPFVRSGFTTCMVPKLLTEKGNYTWSDLFNLILLKATSQQSPIVGLSTINKYVGFIATMEITKQKVIMGASLIVIVCDYQLQCVYYEATIDSRKFRWNFTTLVFVWPHD